MNGAEAAQAFAATLVDELAACGLRSACISPGSRSGPLAMAFARDPRIRVFVHIDERSGSFFGLGLAKQSGRPVALLCTSGTAAAEFHAAVLEAHQSRTPLLVLTADRPPELRDVGANQAIDQVRLYGTAVRWFADPGVPEDLPGAARRWRRLAARALAEAAGPPAGPVHLNLPFREPLSLPAGSVPKPVPAAPAPAPPRRGRLLPDDDIIARLATQLESAHRPLVVAGGMPDGHRLAPFLDALARRAGGLILPEPTSHLRVRGLAGVVDAYDALLRVAPGALQPPDLVLRVGAAPTSKSLNAWLSEIAVPTVLIDPDGAWQDPDQLATEVIGCDPEALLQGVVPLLSERGARSWQQSWLGASAATRSTLERALAQTSLHEGHAVAALARWLPRQATLTVGSSMPIRDLDTFWPAQDPGPQLLANRGASGIDGIVSTGLGAAAGGRSAVVLIGDLSLYHDMNGLWAVRRHGLRALFVVLDNNGGGIFSFLGEAQHHDVFEELFGTPLDLRLEDIARLYGLQYRQVEEPRELERAMATVVAGPDACLLAVKFSRESSVAGHRSAWEAVAAALSGQGAQ